MSMYILLTDKTKKKETNCPCLITVFVWDREIGPFWKFWWLDFWIDHYWIVKNINDLFFFFASFVFSVFLIVRQYIACLKIWFNDIQGRRFFFSFFDCHTRCSYSCTVVWTVGNKNNVRCTRRSLLYIHYMAR